MDSSDPEQQMKSLLWDLSMFNLEIRAENTAVYFSWLLKILNQKSQYN